MLCFLYSIATEMGGVPVRVENQMAHSSGLVRCTTSRPPWQAATEERAMGQVIRDDARAQELEVLSLSELIHQEIRVAIETAVHEELRAALGATLYERSNVRRGYRNGTKTRTLTGPTGPVELTLPRATLFAGAKEWTSGIVPRYHRRMPEVNEAIVATYLAAATRDGFVARFSHFSRPLRSQRAPCRV
jgi:hypothetical protein